jgi:hypothetical protein
MVGGVSCSTYLCDLLLLHENDLDFGMAYDELYRPSTCTRAERIACVGVDDYLQLGNY